MNGTLEMLKSLIPQNKNKMSLEEIAQSYQQQEDSALLALAFDRVFLLIISKSSKYYKINSEDVASLSLEQLHRAMKDYDPDYGTKFTTLFVMYLENELRRMTEFLALNPRKLNSETENVDDHLDLSYTVLDFSESELLAGLGENERLLCQALIGGARMADLPEMFGYSSSLAYKLRGKLKNNDEFYSQLKN